jgi:hypothetical protein
MEARTIHPRGGLSLMNNIIYLVGLVVVVGFLLKFLGVY